jgi:hypothetical protein
VRTHLALHEFARIVPHRLGVFVGDLVDHLFRHVVDDHAELSCKRVGVEGLVEELP